MRNLSSKEFIDEFIQITGLVPSFNNEYLRELEKLIQFLSKKELRPFPLRRKEFIAHTNRKFRLNAKPLAAFLKACALESFTFHYHHKVLIQRSFDLSEPKISENVLSERGVPQKLQTELMINFIPINDNITLEHLRTECNAPSKLRILKGDRDIQSEIIMAHFSAFMWVSLPERLMHEFFDPDFSESTYFESYWSQLHIRSPQLFNRDNALHIVNFDDNVIDANFSITTIRNSISSLISSLYNRITNYGFLALVIKPIYLEGRNVEWEIASAAILFAEKHREYPFKKSYFRSDIIGDKTKAYIPNIDFQKAHFELVNEGFSYKDCFVLSSKSNEIDSLLLIFQKNDRDETPIPCPTCRSKNVQGNSYPILGVRSWECCNLLCPDRSKYNRGKRYSFRGLAMQQAIDDDQNTIPVESVRRWNRDVIYGYRLEELAEMLLRHYTMYGDTVHVHNWDSFKSNSLGRKIKKHKLMLENIDCKFWEDSFFARFAFPSKKKATEGVRLGDDSFQVIQGDSAEVLRSLPDYIFDGAVTSPPYYNAREYSQWPNMYCHLHDMFDINNEVYRVLKPGAIYLYNVFDYFDNENTIVFSAMGQRRMILSAYTVDIFRRIGFILEGNIVWDKGDIEGKRGFNAGNFSPYYQAPFNCWEHVFIFRKPFNSILMNSTNANHNYYSCNNIDIRSHILKQKPVIKIVKGENTHGHSAPFPDAIPELLISMLEPGSIVLDPFGGSLTTGRTAEKFGIRSLCIEKSLDYCKLGLSMRAREKNRESEKSLQLSLF